MDSPPMVDPTPITYLSLLLLPTTIPTRIFGFNTTTHQLTPPIDPPFPLPTPVCLVSPLFYLFFI